MEQQSWRTGLAQDSRNKIVTKIMDTLQRHTPLAGQDGVKELWKIARRFEEKIFYAASDQHDYLRKISLKMLNLETRTQNATSSTLATGSSGTTQGPVRPSVDAGGIAQGQSWQQVGQPTPANVLNNGIQGSAGGPASSFSGMNNVPQPSLTNAGSIAQVQSRQQGVQPTPASMLNNGMQSSTGASTASFSSINNGPNQGPIRPLVDSGNIVQAQSRQQVAQPSPAGMLSNGIQSTAGGPAASFSGITNVQQPAPVMNALGPVAGNLAALNGGSLSNNASGGQAPQNLHSQSVLLASQQRIAQLHQARQQQQQQQQQHAQQQVQQQHAQPLVPTGIATQQGGSIQQQQQQPFSSQQQLQPSQPTSQQQQQLQQQQHQSQQQQQQQQSLSQQPHLLLQQRIQQQQAFIKQKQSLQQQPTQPLLQQPQQPGLQQQPQAQGGPGDSLQQVSQAGGIDQADTVWTKMQTLKEKYLQDMKDLNSMLTTRSQQHMPQEQLQKLTHYKTVLQRMMPYLMAPKGSLPKEFKQDKVEAFEKQIVSIMDTFKRRNKPQQQQGNLGLSSAGQQPQQAAQILQPDNKPLQQQQQPQQQTLQMNAAPTELQSNNTSNSSFPLLQSNASSLQQAMGVTAQPTPLNSLANPATNALHQGNMASFGQNTVNPLQMNLPAMQQQQQDQQFSQNRLLKDQEQSKQLQVRHFQQQQHLHLQKAQQAQLLQAQSGQLPPMTTDTSGDSRMTKNAALIKQMLNPHTIFQQLQQQQQQQQQHKGSSLQAASSPHLSPVSQLSPQNELQNVTNPSLLIPKVGTPASTPPFMMPSPSPVVEDSESKPLTPAVPIVAPGASGQVATPSGPSVAIGTPGPSVSPLLGDYTTSPQVLNIHDRSQTYYHGTAEDKQTATEPPMKRLIKTINQMSPAALSSAISDINLLIGLSDKLGGSAPGAQSRAAVGEDLAQVTKCRTQVRVLSSPDGSGVTKKVKRRFESMALSLVSSDGSVVNNFQRQAASDVEMESTATSKIKCSKFEIELHEEINQINSRLIETRVEVDHQRCEEVAADGKEGIVVSCSYNAIAMEPNTAFQSSAYHMAFPSLRLLVPPQYPYCSPIVLEDDTVSNPNNPLSYQAWDTFRQMVRALPQPVLLRDMVKAWDSSAHGAVVEAAIGRGGGCFSSSYGTWENYVNA